MDPIAALLSNPGLLNGLLRAQNAATSWGSSASTPVQSLQPTLPSPSAGAAMSISGSSAGTHVTSSQLLELLQSLPLHILLQLKGLPALDAPSAPDYPAAAGYGVPPLLPSGPPVSGFAAGHGGVSPAFGSASADALLMAGKLSGDSGSFGDDNDGQDGSTPPSRPQVNDDELMLRAAQGDRVSRKGGFRKGREELTSAQKKSLRLLQKRRSAAASRERQKILVANLQEEIQRLHVANQQLQDICKQQQRTLLLATPVATAWAAAETLPQTAAATDKQP